MSRVNYYQSAFNSQKEKLNIVMMIHCVYVAPTF